MSAGGNGIIPTLSLPPFVQINRQIDAFVLPSSKKLSCFVPFCHSCAMNRIEAHNRFRVKTEQSRDRSSSPAKATSQGWT